MKRIFTLVALLVIFTFSSLPVRASAKSTSPSASLTAVSPSQVEYSLPYPGILPDSPLFTLKTYRDKILLWLTKDLLKKSNLNLLISDKYLTMGQLLREKGSDDLSATTINDGEKYLLDGVLNLEQAKKTQNLPPGLADKFELAAKKHKEIINKLILESTNETYKKNLNQAVAITNQAIGQIAYLK